MMKTEEEKGDKQGSHLDNLCNAMLSPLFRCLAITETTHNFHETTRDREWKDALASHESLKSNAEESVVCGYGPIDDFHQGLEEILGPPKKLLFEAMAQEHCASIDSNVEFLAAAHGITTTSKVEWHYVVDPSAPSLEMLNIDAWPEELISDDHPLINRKRKPIPLDDFEESLNEINERLNRVGLPNMTTVELIACRLYTGPMGMKYNRMLRAHTAGGRQPWRWEVEAKLSMGNAYPTTMHVIQSAIAKLGKINPNSYGYTGIAGYNTTAFKPILLPESFWVGHPELQSKGGVEGSFISMAGKREVAKHYATDGAKDVNGIILEINMGTMDRGAETNWLSQYPHEDEILLPPLTFLHVDHIRLDDKENRIIVVQARSRINQAIKVDIPLLTDEENRKIRQILRQYDNKKLIPNNKLLSRFTDEENFLITGNPMKSVLGLPFLMNIDYKELKRKQAKGMRAMEKEILASNEKELIANMKYVFYETASEAEFSNGIRDIGKQGMTLNDFMKKKEAIESNLSIEHVAALRLYTTSAFRFINAPLRNSSDESDSIKISHPFPATVSFIDEGIKLLRAATAKALSVKGKSEDLIKFGNLYRGLKNTRVAEEFLHANKGGTELGLLSTTKDLKIAVEYSKSTEGNALLFKFKIDNMKQLGADLKWLSAFPAEEEILFPPLTFLQPTGRVETTTISGMAFTTIEVVPHV